MHHCHLLQVVTIKDEPVDLDFYEDNIEIISESTSDSNLVSSIKCFKCVLSVENKNILKLFHLIGNH